MPVSATRCGCSRNVDMCVRPSVKTPGPGLVKQLRNEKERKLERGNTPRASAGIGRLRADVGLVTYPVRTDAGMGFGLMGALG